MPSQDLLLNFQDQVSQVVLIQNSIFSRLSSFGLVTGKDHTSFLGKQIIYLIIFSMYNIIVQMFLLILETIH